MGNREERERMTHEAMTEPRIGDRFTEMYSFWLYIVGISKTHVMSIEAGAPCILPDDGKVVISTKEEFAKRFEYSGMPGKYSIDLVSRGEDISWFNEYPESVVKYMSKRNEIIHNSKKAEWDKVQDLLDDISEMLENPISEKDLALINKRILWENIIDEDHSTL